MTRKRKLCDIQDCTKQARGKTDKCVAHGGGERCAIEGCTKEARGKPINVKHTWRW